MEDQYFRIDGEKVFFRYFSRFEPDEYDWFNGVFNLKDYKKEISKLNADGNCELLGENCSLKILKREGLIDIVFCEGNQSIDLFGLEKKILPE